jgi:putative molybdopterin biosynthesis protein
MARKRYLKKTPLRQARELFLERIDATRIPTETLPVEQALNRITAEPVFAKLSSPHYHGSAMDGICVRAEDTFGATEFSSKRLNLVTEEA